MKNLVIAIILALLSAIFFAMNKGFAARIRVEEWLVTKKGAAISCVPGNNESKNKIPYKKDGGCSHMGISCTLFNTGNRRNKIHSC